MNSCREWDDGEVGESFDGLKNVVDDRSELVIDALLDHS